MIKKAAIQARGERGWKSKEATTTQVEQSTAKDSQVKESQKGRGGQTKGEHTGSAFKSFSDQAGTFSIMASYRHYFTALMLL